MKGMTDEMNRLEMLSESFHLVIHLLVKLWFMSE